MSYLYNAYAGSLDDLRARLGAVDLADEGAVKAAIREHDPAGYDELELDDEEVEDGAAAPMVLSALVEGTWIPSPQECLNWLDWHEERQLLELARTRLSDEGADLLGWLFQAPPLDVSPVDWGFCGSLTHLEVGRLRDELASVLPQSAIDAARAERSGHDWLAAGDPVDVPLSYVYLSLAGVPAGRDIAVRLA